MSCEIYLLEEKMSKKNLKRISFAITMLIILVVIYVGALVIADKSSRYYKANDNESIEEIATHVIEKELALRSHPMFSLITGIKNYRITGVSASYQFNALCQPMICTLIFYDEEYISDKDENLIDAGGVSIEGNWRIDNHVYFDLVKSGDTYTRVACTHAP